MLVKRLTDAIGDELNDVEVGFEHTRWKLPQLYEYITEGFEQLAVFKPELFAATQVVRLVRGSRQEVPYRFLKLVDVSANTDSTGTYISTVVPTSFMLQRYYTRPSCTSSGVSSFSVDARNPRFFNVHPAVGSHPAQYVEILGQTRPPVIDGSVLEVELEGGNVDLYFNAIKDWALYRAFMRDTESQSSLARAQQHYKAFYQFLGAKMASPQKNTNAATNADI